MKRREFIKNSVLGIASTSATAAMAEYLPDGHSDAQKQKKSRVKSASGSRSQEQVYASQAHRLFPVVVPAKQWTRFNADGFAKPACGIVYRKEDDVPHGMPLGGLATGFMDIETDGTFGYFDLFNSGVPTRGPIQHVSSA